MKNLKLFGLLMAGYLLFSTDPANAASCSVSRGLDSEGTAPISWNHGDYITNTRSSRFVDNCNVPAGSIITSVRAHYSYTINRNVLTNGIVPGRYGVNVTANGMTGYVQHDINNLGQTTEGSNGNISTLNGMDLHGLNFNVSSRVTNATPVRCGNTYPGECDQFMYATYGLTINYEPASTTPDPVAWVLASVNNGNDVTISWAASADTTYYEREVSINGGAYQNKKILTMNSITFYDQQSRIYRYRIRACNTKGCSDWQYSNTIAVTIPPKSPPTSVTAQILTDGDDIKISWSRVRTATYYNREVSINGGNWQNRKTYTGLSVTFKDQQSRSYQYRVRACNDYGCSAWRVSNTVTVN